MTTKNKTIKEAVETARRLGFCGVPFGKANPNIGSRYARYIEPPVNPKRRARRMARAVKGWLI